MAKKQQGEIMNKRELLDSSDPIEPCEDCPGPEGCIWECKKERYLKEDVAKIRGETSHAIR